MAEQVAGLIKTFNPLKGWGFITSDQVEGDIYFKAQSLPQELRDVEESFFKLVGRSVLFELFTMPDGKHQARGEISLVPDDTTTLVGTVKSFSEKDNYGFIVCPSVEGDVFFKLKFVPPHMGGVKGQVARFNLNVTDDGKAQANKIVFKSAASPMGAMMPMGAMSPMAPAWAGMMPMGMMGMGGMKGGMMMGGMPMGMMGGMMGKSSGVKAIRGSAATSKAFGKQNGMAHAAWATPVAWATPMQMSQPSMVSSGVVKSLNLEKGFGFIQSANVAGDVFFKADKVDGEIKPGTPVSFSLRVTPDGKPQASNVTPSLAEGVEVIGSIKSFNDTKGFGFVTVPGQPSDVYFKAQDLPAGMEGTVGAQLRFTVHLTPDGKMQMRSATAVKGNGAGIKRTVATMQTRLSNALGNVGNPYAQPQKRMKTVAAVTDGASCECTVKSYNAQKGWGFLECADVEGDIYFQKKLLPAELQMLDLKGRTGTVQATYTPDGKPQAAALELF